MKGLKAFYCDWILRSGGVERDWRRARARLQRLSAFQNEFWFMNKPHLWMVGAILTAMFVERHCDAAEAFLCEGMRDKNPSVAIHSLHGLARLRLSEFPERYSELVLNSKRIACYVTGDMVAGSSPREEHLLLIDHLTNAPSIPTREHFLRGDYEW